MKKLLPIGVFLILAFVAFTISTQKEQTNLKEETNQAAYIKKTKKTPEEKAFFSEERMRHEYNLQANPATGEIPRDEKIKEFKNAKKAKVRIDGGDNLRAPDASFVNRGPSNLGGRTRAIVVDYSDNTGNTIIAGGVTGGVFRTTNGGTSWTRVSPNNDIHSVSAIVQDPNNALIWYYGTGEASGSGSLNGSPYYGRGIWQSLDGGLTWAQFTGTNSTQEAFDSTFDYIYNLAIDPTTGYLYAAVVGQVLVHITGTWYNVQAAAGCCSTTQETDVAITTGGQIYIAIGDIEGTDANRGVWTTNSVFTAPTKISGVGSFNPTGRTILAIAPSNQNKIYVLFENGLKTDLSYTSPQIEADLWMWTLTAAPATGTWTDYSSKMPDESGSAGSYGNDPFAVQNGYNLIVSVKPDDENFVVIGGVNAYKISDITTATTFTKIGGYKFPTNYAIYDEGGTEHHPDIHALVFNPFNNNILFSGTDGGIHKTDDVTDGTVDWTSLNNNYQTQQFYHVAIDPQSSSDYVIGGLQDNGTNVGGITGGESNSTTQTKVWSGDGVAVGISRDVPTGLEFVGSQNGQIVRRSKGSGYQFGTVITPTGSSSQFVTYFHLDPSNNKNLYYAGNSILYRTTNSSTVTTGTWTNMGAPSGIGNITRFGTPWETYNTSTSYLLIGGSTGKVYRLDDPQNAASVASAVDITPGGASGIVTGLAIHPSNRDIVLLTYSNYGITNIYHTTNATSAMPTWNNAENTTLALHSIRSAAITEVSGETMYVVGTARGLYSSTDPLTVDWTREAPNLIGYALVSSLAYRPADNKLLVGTHGNGMFEATITQVLGLEDNEISKSIKVYPNPVEDRLNLNMPAELSNNASFVINNILGQNVMRGSLENNQVNVNNLDTGMYFIQISSNGKKGVKRFIKE